MAILKDYFATRSDGVVLYRIYSDLLYKIHKVGTNEVYDEAVDMEGVDYEYEEIDEFAEGVDETILKAQAYEILIGERE